MWWCWNDLKLRVYCQRFNRSLNEVLFLFFCMHMVSLGVDDSCVCVRGVLCSFGLMCEICPWRQRATASYPSRYTVHIFSRKEHCYSSEIKSPLLPLCLARYRPRTIIKHKVMKTTTATTPPIKAWSGPCCPKAFGSEIRQRQREMEEKKSGAILTPAPCSTVVACSCGYLLNCMGNIFAPAFILKRKREKKKIPM